MYEINEILEPYFNEIDPKKRLEIMNELQENDTLSFLQYLYNQRYSDHDNKGRKNVDWWLWRCICLQQLCNKGIFFRSFRDKEMKIILDELQMNDENNNHKAFLYHEYRNTARRYLSTCRSANYANRLMGFRKSSEEEKVLRACEDIWQMSRGVARKTGLEEKMTLWCEALYDELMNFDSLCHDEYKRLNK